MASAKYDKVSNYDEEGDLENSGDVQVAVKESQRWSPVVMIRIALEFALLVSTFGLISWNTYSRSDNSSNLRSMPSFPTQNVLFQAQPMYASADSFANSSALHETLHRWTKLSPKGRGSIVVDPKDRIGLSPPYVVSVPPQGLQKVGKDTEDIYMVATFHQLHCLSKLMLSYGLMVTEGSKPTDLAHDAHCFDLIRQTLLCNPDLTVEGLTEYGEGWGAVHQCKDIDAVRDWASEHAGYTGHHWPDIL
ncbi:hypothetical protein BX600DRAFT_452031 [Xylariales sp. PMI_506]|nr:hypothetical protein BX600DRAFT_452031 [Xylariales sp. PMI_506]